MDPSLPLDRSLHCHTTLLTAWATTSSSSSASPVCHHPHHGEYSQCAYHHHMPKHPLCQHYSAVLPASESDPGHQQPSSSSLQNTKSVSTHAARHWERHMPLPSSHIVRTDVRHRIGSWRFDIACICRKWSAVCRRCRPVGDSHALGVRRGTRSGRVESSGGSLSMIRLRRGCVWSCGVMGR